MRCFVITCFIILSACQQSEHDLTRTIDMYNGDGDMVGTATLRETADGVEVKLKVEGLAPGFHGIHFHEFPVCEGPDFTSAGNHLNPEGKEHGLMHPDGSHLGDLPNVEADSSGVVDAELMVAGATLLDGKKSLLAGEGTSLIIHETADDGISQPAGNAGARILCGELKKDLEAESENSSESPTDPTETDKKEEE